MKKFLTILLIVVLVAGAIWLFLPNYARVAIRYLYPGIDDLELFSYNDVSIGDPEPYMYDANYNKAVINEEERTEIESYKPVSYLVTKDGKLLYEEYWDNYTDSTNSNIFSASKSIIGLLVGIAIDKGFITSENDLVSKYIPELGQRYDPIIIKDLLTMSSGLHWEEGYSSLFSPTTELYYDKDMADQVLNLDLVNSPGKYHYYSSGTTAILGILLTNATKMTVSDFASKYLWSEIGAEHNAQWSLDHEGGVEKSYCCFYSNARDLARIGQLVINNGKWGSKRIISKDYLDKSFTPASYLKDENNRNVDYYGYQWWLLNYKCLTIKYARGLYGQYIIAIPEKNVVVVRLGNEKDDAYIGEHPKDVFLYIDLALDMIE